MTDEPARFTLTRAELVRITEEAITQAETPLELAEPVREVARTIPQVALNMWKVRDCGCIVGSLHLTEDRWDHPCAGTLEWFLGISFDAYLGEALGVASDDLASGYGIVTIIDNEEDA